MKKFIEISDCTFIIHDQEKYGFFIKDQFYFDEIYFKDFDKLYENPEELLKTVLQYSDYYNNIMESLESYVEEKFDFIVNGRTFTYDDYEKWLPDHLMY